MEKNENDLIDLAMITTCGSVLCSLANSVFSKNNNQHDEIRMNSNIDTKSIIQCLLFGFVHACYTRVVLKKNDGKAISQEDIMLIISDLGQSLYTLFGRHWIGKTKKQYQKMIGTPPKKTPDLMKLLKDFYPKIGWDIRNEGTGLWDELQDFVENVYKDLIKHFNSAKFIRISQISWEDLTKYMNIVRRTWIWFIEAYTNTTYSTDNSYYSFFLNEIGIFS